MSEEEYMSNDDDGFENEEKILVNEIKERSKEKHLCNKNVLFAFNDEEEGEDEVSDIDMGSDLEDQKDYLPDERSWGQNRKNFYNTDYVDKDYAGAYNADEAEAAELEEQEAKNIQRRLLEQLSEADFSLVDVTEAAALQSEDRTEVIQADLSKLTKRQKLDLFRKESPEFENLVQDFEAKIAEVKERIIPIFKLIEQGKLRKSPASEFIQNKYRIILNYCVNIVYYILLKTKRIPVRDHPVLKALFRYRQLLNQVQSVDSEIVGPQVDKIIQVFGSTDGIAEEEAKDTTRTKKILRVLRKMVPRKDKQEEIENKRELNNSGSTDEEEFALDSLADIENKKEKEEKRAITYEMAKNKGLTPKRSKEQRNPRVKHRNKYRKANIRRRGQVRTPRAEIPVYGGEPTGIKIGLKKGRKLM